MTPESTLEAPLDKFQCAGAPGLAAGNHAQNAAASGTASADSAADCPEPGCNGCARLVRRSPKVLKLSSQGLPQSWISLEQAVLHYAAGEVRWEAGAQVALFRGGHNAITGLQSRIAVNSIIGTKGVPRINPFSQRPGLTNSKLFARDRNVCAYCGSHFHDDELTREHIIPFAQNGLDHWMNVVTACRACNHRKGNRTPEQAHMPLLYAPYIPSLWEDFILRNRRILADQMEFLMAHLPRDSRLHG